MQDNPPEVAAYFDALFQSQLHSPPIRCGVAEDDAKGKAIFAAKALAAGEPIWTEAPFVAMQHEDNKDFVACCANCFVPLVDSKETWARVLASNAESENTPVNDAAAPEDLAEALEFLQKEGGKSPEESYFSVFKLHERVEHCPECDVAYCSPSCRQLSYSAHHALLCPHGKLEEQDAASLSAFGRFLGHTLVTNEIFQLAAKVVARIVLRFVATQDLAEARQPVDMFCKLPWWDVITSEDDVDGEESLTLEEYRDKFRALLSQTFELFAPGLRENLGVLEAKGELNGLSAESVASACESVLTVDFFAKIVGMFEMNNISMEIDHPFHALGEALAEASPEEKKEMPPALVRVKAALDKFAATHAHHFHGDDDEDDHDHEHAHGANNDNDEDEDEDDDDCGCVVEDFVGVEGTALFSGICTMNHSCDPNCTVLYTKDGAAHVFAVQDIAEGDELCISYIDVDQEVDERNECLREYQFVCHCARCEEERKA